LPVLGLESTIFLGAIRRVLKDGWQVWSSGSWLTPSLVWVLLLLSWAQILAPVLKFLWPGETLFLLQFKETNFKYLNTCHTLKQFMTILFHCYYTWHIFFSKFLIHIFRTVKRPFIYHCTENW
jgi:hypothetical protein